MDIQYFWIVDQLYQCIFAVKWATRLEKLEITTQNTSALRIPAVCDHITYTYGIIIDCYQEQRHVVRWYGMINFLHVLSVKPCYLCYITEVQTTSPWKKIDSNIPIVKIFLEIILYIEQENSRDLILFVSQANSKNFIYAMFKK